MTTSIKTPKQCVIPFNDIQHSKGQLKGNEQCNTEYNDTKYNETEYNDTEYNDTEYNDTKYNDCD